MANQLDPSAVAQRWATGLRAAGPKYAASIMAMTVNPMAKAAANPDKYLAGVQAAVANGKWQNGLLAVSFSDWKQQTASTGATALAAGATKAIPKVQAFMTQFLPYAAQVSARVQSMPNDGSLQASIDRATAAITLMSQFKYQKAKANS